MIDLWPSQQAICDALTASPATYPIYDAIPLNAKEPFIALGAWTALQDDDLAVDSVDATQTIHAWSRGGGKAECFAMLQFIRERLANQQIGTAWACTEDSADVFEDRASTAASRLFHAFAIYRIRATEEVS